MCESQKNTKLKTLKNIYILHLNTHGTYTDTKINNILKVYTSYRYYICALNTFTVLKTFNWPHSWLHRNLIPGIYDIFSFNIININFVFSDRSKCQRTFNPHLNIDMYSATYLQQRNSLREKCDVEQNCSAESVYYILFINNIG